MQGAKGMEVHVHVHVIMTRVRPPNARMPPPHVQCESVRRVTGTGAPSPQAKPVPNPPDRERAKCDRCLNQIMPFSEPGPPKMGSPGYRACAYELEFGHALQLGHGT